MIHEPEFKPNSPEKLLFFIYCLFSGILPLSTRWVNSDFLKIMLSICVVILFLGITYLAKKNKSLSRYWEVSLAFLIFALIQLFNNSIPQYVQLFLHEIPVSGNPLGRTVTGSVVIQLVETVIAIIPILFMIKLCGKKFSSVYAQKGIVGRWIVVS